MKTNSLYKYISGGLMVLVLTCSVLASVVSAQTGNLQPGNSDAESLITQTQAENANQSANTASQNPSNPKQDGGSGNQDTSFSWKYLMPWFWVQSAMKILGNTILMIFGWVLGLVGLIFNFIIDKTIVNLKTTIDSLGVITDIWKVIRDFINLFFIFALLYAAVGTILGLDKVDWKKTVGNLVLAALLINFSLFITKAALDLSNIVTIGFYSQLPGVGAVGPGSTNAALNQSNAGGISNSIMQSLKLETIYKPNYTNNLQRDITNSDAAVGSFAYILSTVMGSIFICVTIVVIVAACWLFLKRFIDIIFLMIRSPIAFAGFVLPQLNEYQSNWWKELQANVLFPPVYMAMMWITFKVLQSPGFQTIAPGVDGFSGLFSTLSGTTVNIAFRFIVVIAMMVYALKSASKAGVEGGEIFNDFLKKKRGQLAGVVGRNTAGRAAAWAQDKNSAVGQALRKLESVPIIGSATSKAITGSLKDVSGAGFGGAKGGFDQAVKDEAKYAKEGYARVGEKAEFRERAPIKPDELTRIDGETEASFINRRSEYDEKVGEYEEANVDYTARKETFEEGQKKNAEGRQTQFRGNYEKTTLFQKNRDAGKPIFAENQEALKAIDKKIEEDKKKEEKANDQTAEWQDSVLSLLEKIGNEAKSAIDPDASPVGVRPEDMSSEMRNFREQVANEFKVDKEKTAGFEDKKERAKHIDEMRKKYKAIEEKIADEEIATLERIEYEIKDAVGKRKDDLFAQKMRMKKSQRARSELNRKLEKMEEKRDRAEEKEREKKEREEKGKDGGGGGDKKEEKKK